MAFLKIDKKKSGDYLSVAQAYRDATGKKRNRILFSMGKVADYTPEQLKRIGERLYELGGGNPKDLLGPNVQELGRYNYGYYRIYNKALKMYGLDKLFRRIARKNNLSYDLKNAVLLMLLERLNEPASKLANFLRQDQYIGIDPTELQWLYRSLDRLSEAEESIQNCVYQYGRDLFNQKLDVVFYDVTTLYFDSEKVEEGAFRQKGFGKDGKVGKTQVVFSMLIDAQKRPIAYRIFSGNTFEGHTFQQAVEDLKKRYAIDKVVVVADRGMLSKNNLETVVEADYEFIMGERLKNLPEEVKKRMLTPGKDDIKIQTEDNPVILRTHEYKGRQVIVSWSQKRAKKDAHKRQERIEKGLKALENQSPINAKAKRFFLKNESVQKYSLDEEKIKKDALYDGYLAVSTNAKHLAPAQVVAQYNQLYKIEHTFRTFKSHLEIRPMFHWTDKRIKGHICLCYIAYSLLNQTQLALQKKGVKMSEKQIGRTLDKMQLSLVEQKGSGRYYLRSADGADQQALNSALGLKTPPNLFPSEQIDMFI